MKSKKYGTKRHTLTHTNKCTHLYFKLEYSESNFAVLF